MPRLKLKDVELSFTIDDYTDPWKKAPWVLLHHGIAGSARQWYAWVPHLARHYKVLRYDARGHGDSSWPQSNGAFLLNALVDDVEGVLNTLSITRAHFIGVSGGGAVGLKLAHDKPGRLRSLTLVSSTPTLSAGSADIPHWLDTIDRAGVGGWLSAGAQARFGNAPEEMAQWYAEDGARTPAAVAKAALSHIASLDLAGLLPAIRLRTLILAGDMDEITPPAVQHQLARGINRSILKLYPGAGHDMHLLTPDLLAADALAFLQKVDEMEDLAAQMGEDC